MIILYTGAGCPACVEAKSWMKAHGIKYEEKDVWSDTEALEDIKSKGFSSIPQFFDEEGNHLADYHNYKTRLL